MLGLLVQRIEVSVLISVIKSVDALLRSPSAGVECMGEF